MLRGRLTVCALELVYPGKHGAPKDGSTPLVGAENDGGGVAADDLAPRPQKASWVGCLQQVEDLCIQARHAKKNDAG